jgi:hypothetical protein
MLSTAFSPTGKSFLGDMRVAWFGTGTPTTCGWRGTGTIIAKTVREGQSNMRDVVGRLSVGFAAGCLGALVNSWLVCYLGQRGIPQLLGVTLAPKWSLAFLYPRLVWGGLWGLLFALPIWRGTFWIGVFSRGILFSLAPTAFQLFYVFPNLLGKGALGLALGKLTPLFVFGYNVVWGLAAALWVYWEERP